MKQFVPGPLADHARNLMRRIGYGEHVGRDGVVSYVKRMHPTPYPRFHAYVEERGGGMQINLHLDQKQASYQGTHAHAGDYEGVVVEREMARLVSLIQSLGTQAPVPSRPEIDEEKPKGFWGKLFG